MSVLCLSGRLRLIDRLLKKILEDSPSHDVRLDFPGRPRFTCYSSGCNEATIIRQPHMNDEQWAGVKKEFYLKHPGDELFYDHLVGRRINIGLYDRVRIVTMNGCRAEIRTNIREGIVVDFIRRGPGDDNKYAQIRLDSGELIERCAAARLWLFYDGLPEYQE